MSLQTQYFPGASTSPYGPCLTLPGTLGSYYTESGLNPSWYTLGFTTEAWVNFASFANSNIYYFGSISEMLGNMNPSSGINWSFGPLVTGQVSFFYWTGATGVNLTSPGTITTGSWNHLCVQCNGTTIYLFINGSLVNSAAISGTPVLNLSSAITLGQQGGFQGPNYAIAKARIVLGTTGTNGNVYSTGSFTPNPNFIQTLPSGATVAWQLESQYPLPTYPSIQDVTPLPSQSGSYGSLPTPVGGVTSNVLGPFTTVSNFDSIRFDGTGYIDYGNAASSALTTNLWASPWTMEAWIYLTALPGGALYPPIFARQQIGGGADWAFQINPSGTLFFQTAAQQISGPTLALGTWYHVAATYDGARCNVYTSYNSSSVGTATVTGADMAYTPSRNFLIAAYPSPTSYYITGNLADIRVSNVARYTGSSYTVPSVAAGTAPFTADRNTLLLLKSVSGQAGTTLEVQGRGLGSVSLGATRTTNAYPPAPMSSYVLDTTGNTAVTYGQGKYVASASTEQSSGGVAQAWRAFDKNTGTSWNSTDSTVYNNSSPYNYTGSVRTVDTLGNSYAGEWLQIQLPVSVLISSYSITPVTNPYTPNIWFILGSRDGINWTFVDQRTGVSWVNNTAQTFSIGATQAYTYYRIINNQVTGNTSIYGANIVEWTINGTEESLCVTSDAKVGVGIANPQRSLEVAGDLVVGGSISGGAGMGSFRNRIINGDMRFAQRGTSSVVPTGVGATSYLLDRFTTYTSFTGGNVTQYPSSLATSDTPYQLGFRYYANLTCLSALTGFSYFTYVQSIEGYHAADLNWGTSFGVPVTVSFWFRTNSPTGSQFTFCMNIYGGSNNYLAPYTVNASGVWQLVTLTIPPPPNGTSVNATNSGSLALYLTAASTTNGTFGWNIASAPAIPGTYNWTALAGNYVHFTGVQLEKGTVATPFEFRPYATELALCQRYFTKLGGTAVYENIGNGVAASSTIANILCPLPVPMRDITTTSVTVLNISNIRLLGNVSGVWNGVTATNIIRDSAGTNCIGLSVTVSGGLTLGQAYILDNTNTTGGVIQINNEL